MIEKALNTLNANLLKLFLKLSCNGQTSIIVQTQCLTFFGHFLCSVNKVCCLEKGNPIVTDLFLCKLEYLMLNNSWKYVHTNIVFKIQNQKSLSKTQNHKKCKGLHEDTRHESYEENEEQIEENYRRVTRLTKDIQWKYTEKKITSL